MARCPPAASQEPCIPEVAIKMAHLSALDLQIGCLVWVQGLRGVLGQGPSGQEGQVNSEGSSPFLYKFLLARSEFEKSYAQVLLYPPQPAAVVDFEGRRANFSAKMYGFYANEQRLAVEQRSLPIDQGFLVPSGHNSVRSVRRAPKYSTLPSRHHMDASPPRDF